MHSGLLTCPQLGSPFFAGMGNSVLCCEARDKDVDGGPLPNAPVTEQAVLPAEPASDGQAATCSSGFRKLGNSCLTFCSKGKPGTKAIEEEPVEFAGVCKSVQAAWDEFISGEMTEKERAFLADKATTMPRRPSTVGGSLQAYAQKYEARFDSLRKMESPSGWAPLKTVDGVEISTQAVEGEPLVYAKGVCVMKTHGKGLRHLVAMMLTAEDRPLYDSLCESGQTIESYLPHYRIVYFKIRPPALAAAVIYPRDSLMIGRLTADADGGQLLLLESTEHDDVPEKPDYVRMTAHVGYAFRPTEDPDAWKVTFAFCADLGGGVPTWVKNRVARDEPLVLAKFKAFYDKEYGPHKKMVHHSKSFTR